MYGVMYLLSFVIHLIVARRQARRLSLRRRVWLVVSICYLLAMSVGAKALFDIQHGQFSVGALFSAQHYMQGGLWGGMLAYFAIAVPVALLLAKHKRAGVDLVALAIPLPWIAGKIGCLLHGCCYGKATSLPWAIIFPEGAPGGAPADIPLHPTQIYEILVMVLVIIAFRLLADSRWRGTMLLWFLAIYGLGRPITEIWRGDLEHRGMLGPLSLSQIICLATAGLSIIALCILAPHLRAMPAPAETSRKTSETESRSDADPPDPAVQ
jgi:phosphatidylglycerol:prolipoprotein diacylglycerol transferase